MNQLVRSTALSGEILGENDRVRVILAAHPLRTERAVHDVPAGLTIAEILALTSGSFSPHFVAYLDGYAIPIEHWHRTRPKPGTTLVLRAVAAEFVSGITAIITSLSAAFSAVSTWFAGLSAFSQFAIGLGISYGSQFLLNALFPTRQPKLSKEPEAQPAYSITGSRNSAAPWDAVSVILGEVRVTPKFGALPFSQSIGQDQHFRELFVVGYGALDITDIKIGETPIESFSDVSVEVRKGYPGESGVTLYTGQPIEEPLQVELRNADSWQTRTTALNVIEIQVDVVFPSGVYWVDGKKGERHEHNVTLAVEYRLFGTGGPWLAMPGISQTTKDPNLIRRTTGIAVPKGQYDVRIRKVTGDADPNGNDTYVERVVWTALRSYRDGQAVTFDQPLALIAVRIKGSAQLNGQLDTLNCKAGSRMLSYSPSVWTGDLPTRNPADLFRHVLQGPANPRPLSDDEIDLESLQAWFSYCYVNGFSFDAEIDTRNSPLEIVYDICAAGRAAPDFKDGRHSVIWDERDTPIVQMFTPSNSWGFEFEVIYSAPVHAYRVRFVNRDKGYVQDERIVYDDGYGPGNATAFETLEFPGVTDPAAIWKHARFHIAQRRLRPQTYTVYVDVEGMVCTRGDRVLLAHDAALIGVEDGRVTAVDVAAQTVTLDSIIDVPEGPCGIRFRSTGSTMNEFFARAVGTPVGTSSRTLQLVGTARMPEVGDLFAFGQRAFETSVFRVLSIEPGEDLTSRLTLVDDAPEISDADTGTIPPFNSNVTVPVDPFTLAPYGLEVVEAAQIDNGLVTYIATATWRTAAAGGADTFIIEATRGDETRRATVSEPVARFESMLPGVWTFRVRGILASGGLTGWSEARSVQIMGEQKVPPNPRGFAISTMGEVATVSWAPPMEPIGSSEVRYTPATAGATWANSVPIVEGAIGGSAQVPFQSGTLLLKHVSFGGVYSAEAALLVVTNAGLQARNVVEEVEEMAPFDGAHDGTWNAPLGLELLSAFDAFGAANCFAFRDAFLGEVGFVTRGVYTLPSVVDLGETFTSRLTVSLMAEGVNTVADLFAYSDAFSLPNAFFVEPEDWTVEVEISTTTDDPTGSPAWSPWSRLIVGDYAARAYRFRLALAASRFGITPRVTYLHVLIDMPDRVEAGRAVLVPVTGLHVPFVPAFREVDGLSRSDRDLATGDQAIVSNLGPTGFDIFYRNASGAAVERTFDWLAKGYGRKVS